MQEDLGAIECDKCGKQLANQRTFVKHQESCKGQSFCPPIHLPVCLSVFLSLFGQLIPEMTLSGWQDVKIQDLSADHHQHHHHHHHHHQSLNHEGHWGTTDDFATSFLHFSLFSTALLDLANSRPVHSLMLSSHLFLCLSCYCQYMPTLFALDVVQKFSKSNRNSHILIM